MAIPLATTTISVLRPDGMADTFESDAGPIVVVSNVSANIGSSRGSGSEVGGQEAVVSHRLVCDPCDLTHKDVVIDETSDVAYSVEWVARRTAFGLDHMVAGLNVANLGGGSFTLALDQVAVGGVSA